MKFVIRKVSERDTTYLERCLPNALIVNDTERRGALWSFREALRRTDDDAVYIQDDMILCRDFVNVSVQAVDKYPLNVIVFANCIQSSQPKSAAFESGFYSPWRAGWLLCTYIPHRIARRFIEDNDSGRWKPRANCLKYDFDDLDFNDWLHDIGEDVYLTVPNLAGHPANKSTINEKRSTRLCWNFDYENAEPGAPDLQRTQEVFRRFSGVYQKAKQSWIDHGRPHGYV